MDNIFSEDPKSLLERSISGDHQAGLEFSEIICQAKYEGDLTRAKTKKEARVLNRLDSLECLTRGAEAGYLPALIEIADAQFVGRYEQKQFGGQVIEVKYAKSLEWNLQLAEFPDIDVNLKAKAYFRIGMCTKFLGQFDSNIDWDEVVKYWEKGAELSGRWANLCQSCIAEYYYSVTKEFDKAIPMLEVNHTTISGSAGKLAHAYLFGNGVEANQAKSEELSSLWEKLVDAKQ